MPTNNQQNMMAHLVQKHLAYAPASGHAQRRGPQEIITVTVVGFGSVVASATLDQECC